VTGPESGLRIAMVVPPFYEIPPSGYGGIETTVATLVDALCERGHNVTIIGAGTGTGTRAEFIGTTPQPQSERLAEQLPELIHTARVNRLLRTRQFDVVHDHTLSGPLTAAGRPVPTVTTAHGPTDDELGELYEALGTTVSLVAISDAQRGDRPQLNWVGTVHNAVDPDEFTVSPLSDGPVLWLARFTPEKGADLAIEACRAAGLPLVLAGKCSEPAEIAYFEETIEPMLGDDVEVVSDADRDETRSLLAKARCLIMPIRWPEPFGMVMIEAMACGRPVVALDRGAVPEVVRSGVTGWICADPAELPDALHRVDELDPEACAAHVRENFNPALMASRYEQIYRAVI
jgi:glycosyltransferase involved in cell wall biosynthesis